jgi:hypothetical protein
MIPDQAGTVVALPERLMSKLADIRRVLSHLRLKLIEHSGDRGLTIDDPEFLRKIEELDRMSQTLRISIRDLKTAQNAASAREQNLWKIPRDKRYAPAASVKDEQREIDQLLRDAAEIQGLVENFIGRICSGNEMEGFHTVAELIGHATEHDSGTTEQPLPGHPAYIPASQAQFHASPETAVIMAYVAIRGLVLISKKISAKIRT